MPCREAIKARKNYFLKKQATFLWSVFLCDKFVAIAKTVI